jgi:hypothetical protein
MAHERFKVVTPESWTSLVRHVRDKVENHYWEVDGLTERYSIQEFTFRISRKPDDDESSSSDGSDTSGPDSDSNDLMASDDEVFQ